MTAKFDPACFHHSSQKREQILAIHSTSNAFVFIAQRFMECADMSASDTGRIRRGELLKAVPHLRDRRRPKVDGQLVKALFNFAGCGECGLGFCLW
jgi:hypothetical protein